MIDLIIPRPGESINEVVISKWFVADGDFVEKNQEVGEIESDKATLPLIAPESGKITLLLTEGTTVEVGKVACKIDETVKQKTNAANKPKEKPIEKSEPKQEMLIKENTIVSAYTEVKTTPVAKKMMDEKGFSVDDIIKGLKRIGKEEVEAVINHSGKKAEMPIIPGTRDVKREPMTQLRKKLSKRLVAVKNETAMLTTFNEVDMSEIMSLRNKHQKAFVDKYGLKLGFMSFFTKAVSIALKQYPKVNSQLDGDDIITPAFVDVAIAVQTDKGLMVPVLRNTQVQSIPQIEKEIAKMAEKARAGRLSIEEMTGGTFTITNGGVFGSLLSTPIINPPQAAILGMHNIVERPVAINGKVEIRPMMYLALSYDHRIIDGKDSVSFLVRVKELIESPYKMLLPDSNSDKLLLDL
jgi:2-oxoglutarate dehydrogenase E2 component (dihydrolipoamide succinyltransferase)